MSGATPAADSATRPPLVVGVLAGAVVLRLWILPLASSLWLDEFGTAWVTAGGFREILDRARLFPQSLPYAAIVWAARELFGASEIALRVPSLLAMFAAAFCLFRLGRELFDRETGLFSAGILLLFPQVAFAAGDARPYAFAVLAATGATWALVAWLRRGGAGTAVAYVALAAATVYFQYLFAALLVTHAAYALRRHARGSPVSGGRLLAAGACLGLLLLPAAALVLEIGRGRAAHAFGPMPGLAQLGSSLVPSRALGVLVASLLLCFLFRAARLAPHASTDATQDGLVFLLLMALVPPILLFAVSHASGAPVFELRYLMCAVPAQAILLAWLLGMVAPPRGRQAVLGTALALVLVLRGGLSRPEIAHGNEDWRAAVAALNAVNGSGPVLLGGSFTESRDLSLVKDPAHAAYLPAPLDFYPARGPVQVLPLRTGAAAEAFAGERLLDSPPGDRFALIERNSRWPSWAPWLADRFRAGGYEMKDVWASDTLRVRIFERAGPARRAPA